MKLVRRLNRTGDKIMFYHDHGRNPGQRSSTGVFVYVNPKDDSERQHNEQAERFFKGTHTTKKGKLNANFLAYYQEYIKLNRRANNRHLENSYNQFSTFVNSSFIACSDITENLCKRFRRHLLDKFTGETPSNYYARFKAVVTAAYSDGHFHRNPSEKVNAKRKPSKSIKNFLEAHEYKQLIATPYPNAAIRSAFIFCCYTGLRWVDVKALKWNDLKVNKLITRIIQAKTGNPVVLTLHPIAKEQLQLQRKRSPNAAVFQLPSADKANQELKKWLTEAGIHKHITWHCARLSFSIILQDNNVPLADVAYLMGHSSTEHVYKTYKRHRPKDQAGAIAKLPG